ncbi:general secretion pathway protein L [Escherichia coli]|uniref:General secretion pathway protein L n=1 Tax=Escherichia coli TaxID=562 RepID=A0A2X1JEI2_ECOLX|nr:general secretion pathway protein L [Escherichia coli]
MARPPGSKAVSFSPFFLLLAAGASRSGIRLRLKINFSNNSKKPGNVISRRSNAPTIFVFYFKQQLAQQYPEAVPLLYHLQTLLLEHPELQLMEANYSQKQKSLTLKMSAKSEANIDRFCELTQSWLPMEKTEKDPVSGVWTVRNSGK